MRSGNEKELSHRRAAAVILGSMLMVLLISFFQSVAEPLGSSAFILLGKTQEVGTELDSKHETWLHSVEQFKEETAHQQEQAKQLLARISNEAQKARTSDSANIFTTSGPVGRQATSAHTAPFVESNVRAEAEKRLQAKFLKGVDRKVQLDNLARKLDLSQPYKPRLSLPEKGDIQGPQTAFLQERSAVQNQDEGAGQHKEPSTSAELPAKGSASLDVKEQIKWLQLEIAKHQDSELRANNAAALLKRRADTLKQRSTAILRAGREAKHVVGAQTEMYL